MRDECPGHLMDLNFSFDHNFLIIHFRACIVQLLWCSFALLVFLCVTLTLLPLVCQIYTYSPDYWLLLVQGCCGVIFLFFFSFFAFFLAIMPPCRTRKAWRALSCQCLLLQHSLFRSWLMPFRQPCKRLVLLLLPPDCMLQEFKFHYPC